MNQSKHRMANNVVSLAPVLLFLLVNVTLFSSSSLLSWVLVTHGISFVLFHLYVISRKFSSCPNIIISHYRQILLCMICWSRRHCRRRQYRYYDFEHLM